jgi:hypothetical protein
VQGYGAGSIGELISISTNEPDCIVKIDYPDFDIVPVHIDHLVVWVPN